MMDVSIRFRDNAALAKHAELSPTDNEAAMWFKNLRIYRLDKDYSFDADALEDNLAGLAFTPCGKMDSRRFGWVAPIDREAAPLAHWGNGCVMICAREQQKLLPASVVKEQLDEQVRSIEKEQARKVFKREKRRLKDELIHTLLPQALASSKRFYAVIAPQAGLLLIDTPMAKRAEEVLNLLRDSLGSLPVKPLEVAHSPVDLMTRWLAAGRPEAGYLFGHDCDLRDPLDAKNMVRCRAQELASAEIKTHLEAGKQAAMLGLDWNNRISFCLHEDMSLKRLVFSDILETQAQLDDADHDAQFDSDFTIMAGELQRLVESLLEVFGEPDSD